MFKNAKDPKKAEKITSIVALIVIAAVAVFFLRGYIFNTEDVAVDPNLIDSRDMERAQIGQRLFEVLGSITQLKLEPTVLTHPAFSTLRDLETEIPSQEIGKPNPFQPLPNELSAQSTGVR